MKKNVNSCLDETKQLQEKVNGERIAMTPVPNADQYLPFTVPIIVATRISGISDRPLLLELDSGIDIPLLFECGMQLPHVQTIGTSQRRGDKGEIQQGFAVLMPQDMRVGGQFFRQISFVTPVGADIPVKPDVDGVLPQFSLRAYLSATPITLPFFNFSGLWNRTFDWAEVFRSCQLLFNAGTR